jgi:hypothetical protein
MNVDATAERSGSTAFPRGFQPRCQHGVCRNDTHLFLVCERDLSLPVPALVELSFELGNLVFASMVRGVTVARREVHEGRLIGSGRVLHMDLIDSVDPIDSAIAHVADQDVVRDVTPRRTIQTRTHPLADRRRIRWRERGGPASDRKRCRRGRPRRGRHEHSGAGGLFQPRRTGNGDRYAAAVKHPPPPEVVMP